MADSQSRWPSRLAICAVALASAGWFGWKLDDQPFFDDESCYIAYSYYFRLTTNPNHENWLHFAAFDSPPFYKYLIGSALYLFGRSPPDSIVPAERWHGGDRAAPADPAILRAARVAMLVGAVLGCVAIYLCGRELVGPKSGAGAALLLAASPLYWTHARRAMADDWTQALVLLALWSCSRLWTHAGRRPRSVGRLAGWTCATGCFAGLAMATKLSGLMAALAISLTTFVLVWTAVLSRSATTSRPTIGAIVLAVLAVLLAGAIFLGVNPYFYAQPKFSDPGDAVPTADRQAAKRREMALLAQKHWFSRLKYMFEYRAQAQTESVAHFPDYALPTAWSRWSAAYLEGLGRWSALGRFPDFPPQAAGDVASAVAKPRGDQLPGIRLQGMRAAAGAVLAVLGLLYCWSQGRRQLARRQLPAAWIFAVWALLEWALLSRTLTLDWDRYYMGVVCSASLLIAVGMGGTLARIGERIVLAPPGEEETP